MHYIHTQVLVGSIVPLLLREETFHSLDNPHTQLVADRKMIVDKLWREFFSDPSQWWDHRLEKGNTKHPDFKHKNMQQSLWLDCKFKPPWVEAELAAMAPGTVQANIFSWNKRLVRYVKAGHYEKTVELFQQMQQEAMQFDKFTFTPVLNACTHLKLLEEGKRIHTMIIESGCESDVFVGNTLIHMYVKCGSIEDAWTVFNKISKPDVVSWNAMIMGLAKCGQGQKALELSQQMQLGGVEPDSVTFLGMLTACSNVAALDEGKRVHEKIIQRGFESSVFLGSSLIDMYAKCGSIEDAWTVFKKMPTHNVVSWNSLIHGCVKCSQGQKALELFRQMQSEGMEPDAVTFVGVLTACTSVEALEEGRYVHEQIIQRGFESSVFVGCSLVDMYAKCGSIDDARTVFNKLPTRNVVSWNAMIQGHVKCGQGLEALELFQQMQQDGVEPDPVTFIGVLNACASVALLEEGRRVHAQIIQNHWESDVFVCSSLIDMYAKCGSIDDAWTVFNKVPTRNVVSWNAMIQGHVKCGQGKKALNLFQQMEQEGVEPVSVTFVVVLTACASIAALEEGRRVHQQIIQRGFESDVCISCSLIDMYAKCRSIDNAWDVFDKMDSRVVVAWNAMIWGYIKCGQSQKALELSLQMRRDGVEPDPITFVGILNACASVAALGEGRHVHERIIERGYDLNVFVCSSLIDMYAKCGSIRDAEIVFNKMSTNNVVSWNAMLGGYAMHGESNEAFGLFKRMCQEGVEMDAVTFVCLLSACRHGGLVDEGLQYFESLSTVYSISATVEHYACLVDLLARAGLLHEAEDLIKLMPFEVDAKVWLSLLGACRVQGNMEMGERAAKEVLELDPGSPAGYVLLSNIYAGGGKWDSKAVVSP